MTIAFDKEKDIIKIIAPSSLKKQDVKFVKESSLVLEQLGYKVLCSNELGITSGPLPFYANDLNFRVKDLQEALNNNQVKIIWAFAGGYGATEVIEHIKTKPLTPKILIGFSDITALHSLFNQTFNMPSIHGPLLVQLLRHQNPEAINDIINITSGKPEFLEYKIEPLQEKYRDMRLSGKIFGGNLEVFTKLIGTSHHPNTKNGILILEDVDERGYMIMRNLVHARQAGLINHLKAIIFGDFSNGKEKDNADYTDVSINEFTKNINIPCYKMKNFGHVPINLPIILGAQAQIHKSTLINYNPFINIQ